MIFVYLSCVQVENVFKWVGALFMVAMIVCSNPMVATLPFLYRKGALRNNLFLVGVFEEEMRSITLNMLSKFLRLHPC